MIKRKLFKDLEAHIPKKEITVLIGPRQAGKTTLLFLLKDHIEKKGGKTIFLNLDIERDKQFFVSQDVLLSKIELEFGKSKGTVFIDEIQRKENAGLFLKGIYDMKLPYKFVVSGSGSLELKEQIHESLAGRKRIFELNTLSFEEFVNFKTNYHYEQHLDEFLAVDKIQRKILFDQYVTFGGYPSVVLADTIEEKRRIIDEIYQSYLIRDISYLLGVRHVESFSQLIQILASQIGNLVNTAKLSRMLGISHHTVNQYIYYLEKTFIISRLSPIYKNIRKEIVKSPVFYFNDLGLRNYSLGIFGDKLISNDGLVFENLVFNILKDKISHSGKQLHFWRTKDGAEVDFVVSKSKETIPVEAKCMSLKQMLIPKSFRSFISQFTPKEAFLVNLDLNEGMKLDNTDIKIISLDKLMFSSI